MLELRLLSVIHGLNREKIRMPSDGVVKLLGQHFSLRYPEAWVICAPNPLIWEV